MLGVSVFFHSYVVTIPSWVNEKAPGVSINRSIFGPSVLTAIIKARVPSSGSGRRKTAP